jgi:hypothetical protein
VKIFLPFIVVNRILALSLPLLQNSQRYAARLVKSLALLRIVLLTIVIPIMVMSSVMIPTAVGHTNIERTLHAEVQYGIRWDTYVATAGLSPLQGTHYSAHQAIVAA